MSLLFAGSYGLLLVSALFMAARCYRYSEHYKHTPTMVISLAGAFIACAAAANLLIHQPDQDLQTLLRLLDNLAFYAAIPLLASAAVDHSWRLNWSKAAWGRWLLVLFALFELNRRAENGVTYSQIMAVLSVLTIAVALLRLPGLSSKVVAALISATFACALLLFSAGSLIETWAQPALYALALSPALLLYGLYFRSAAHSSTSS